MRDNIELQIKMIENKIRRLELQKEFYSNLIEIRFTESPTEKPTRGPSSDDQNSYSIRN